MGHAASMSLYDFCNGDPVNYFDADGRLSKKGSSDDKLYPDLDNQYNGPSAHDKFVAFSKGYAGYFLAMGDPVLQAGADAFVLNAIANSGYSAADQNMLLKIAIAGQASGNTAAMIITAASLGASAKFAPEFAPQPTNSKILTLDPAKYPIPLATLEQANALGVLLPVNRPAAPTNRRDALANYAKVPGMQLDEAPPAMFRNPGDPVIVVPTPPSQNQGAGASLGNQARSVPDGGTVIIVPKEKWPR
jgi:hypothetical protein